MATKTLVLLIAFSCVVATASASIMLEKWLEVFDLLDFNSFLKAMIWQLYSTLGPLLGGLVRTTSMQYYGGMDADTKYGAQAAGIGNGDDIFIYFMNYVIYGLIFANLGVSYTADEFVEIDFSALDPNA